jgi:hypothetical protein
MPSKSGYAKAKWMKSSVTPRCPAAAMRVNGKRGRSIYLVDNKQGGIEFGWADVYCAELGLIAGSFRLFFNPACQKLWGATY